MGWVWSRSQGSDNTGCVQEDDVLVYVATDMYLRLSHVISHLICHVELEKWPKATTPCAPPEKGNALVAYVLVAMKEQTKERKGKG